MNNKMCEIHNEPELFCEQDAQQKLLFMCRFCVKQRFDTQNINDVDNEQKQAIQQLEYKYDQKIDQLKKYSETVDQYTIQIQQQFQKFKQQVDLNIQYTIEKKNKLKNICQDLPKLQQNQINEEENIINDGITQIKEQLKNQLKEIEINTKLDQLYYSLDNLLNDANYKDKDYHDIKKITDIYKRFDYQMIQNSTYKQREQCYAIAFNKDASIMIAGCDELIKVFEFKDFKLREVQFLHLHTKNVTCLKFMKKSNQFVSASEDSTIIIWEQFNNNYWQSIQILKDHKSDIYCNIMNQNEDLLISGSRDNTIKFWNKQNNIWSSNQSIYCQSYVYSISLNNQDDQLIASVRSKQILIIQLQGKQWMIKYKISVEQNGNRLCFINQGQFVFQPFDRQHLQIFDYNPNDKIYKKRQELLFSNLAPDIEFFFSNQYIPQIELLIVRNGQSVHLIKRSQNGLFTVEQSINFQTYSLFGCITDDGKFIATWDDKSCEIQIRKFDF